MDNSAPNIFQYSNYRDYLNDYYQARKVWDNGFTHTYICFCLGQKNSRTLFNNIVKGRRDISPLNIDRFIELLELTEEESSFFRTLVMYNQTTSLSEKEYYFDQLLRMASTPRKLLSEDQYSYYNTWYHSAIRALLDIFDFKDNFLELAEKLCPPISESEAKYSIVLMKKLNLIQENEEGFLKPTEKAVTAGEGIQNRLIPKYQMQVLDQGKMAIMADDQSSHKLMTFTVGVSDNGFQRILRRSNEYRKELFAIVNQDEEPAERLFQITLQIVAKSS